PGLALGHGGGLRHPGGGLPHLLGEHGDFSRGVGRRAAHAGRHGGRRGRPPAGRARLDRAAPAASRRGRPEHRTRSPGDHRTSDDLPFGYTLDLAAAGRIQVVTSASAPAPPITATRPISHPITGMSPTTARTKSPPSNAKASWYRPQPSRAKISRPSRNPEMA